MEADIHVETYADAIGFCDRPNPVSVIDAKFSLQHAVAIVVELGEPTLADFEPDAIAALAEIRGQVTVAEAPDIIARYPEQHGALIVASGVAVELFDTRGDPDRPLAKDGIIEKTQTLIRWGGLSVDETARATALALEGDDPNWVQAGTVTLSYNGVVSNTVFWNGTIVNAPIADNLFSYPSTPQD